MASRRVPVDEMKSSVTGRADQPRFSEPVSIVAPSAPTNEYSVGPNCVGQPATIFAGVEPDPSIHIRLMGNPLARELFRNGSHSSAMYAAVCQIVSSCARASDVIYPSGLAECGAMFWSNTFGSAMPK